MTQKLNNVLPIGVVLHGLKEGINSGNITAYKEFQVNELSQLFYKTTDAVISANFAINTLGFIDNAEV